MKSKKTHTLVKTPTISGKILADFMAGSERRKRSLIRSAKYKPHCRMFKHSDAKSAISKYIRAGHQDTSSLKKRSQELRRRITDSVFESETCEHNADFIDRFIKVSDQIEMPKGEIIAQGKPAALVMNGVKVTPHLHFRLLRKTGTNKVYLGAGMLRYQKGKPLPLDIAEWQSAFIFGYLREIGIEEYEEVNLRLCVTLDAYSGAIYPAPTNSITRFKNMEAACETIAERWGAIAPPPNSVL